MPNRGSALRLALIVVALAPLVPPGQAAVEPPGARQPQAPAAPRVAPLPESKWTSIERQLVDKYGRGGQADAALATLLHLPALVEAIMPYTVYLENDSTLVPRHRELLMLRTAWLAGSQSIWSTQAPRARAVGLTAAETRRIAEGPEAAAWDGFEADLLRLADELYINSAVTDRTWRSLAGTYDLLQMMDAVETVNHFVVLAMLFNSLGVQPDSPADRLPDVRYRITVPIREPPLGTARVAPLPGDGLAVSRTLARHAKMNQARSQRTNFINRVSKLTPRHREMLILRIGWLCQSEYEWAQHVGSVGRAREHGLEPVRIAQGPAAPGWDAFEREILRAVDELYRDAMVSDRTWAALSARYDAGLMMSAVLTASSYRATSMVLNAFGVQLQPGDERFPELSAR